MPDDTDSPGYIEKLGNENPVMLLLLGIALGAALFFLINRFTAKK